MIQTINPATEKVIKTYSTLTQSDAFQCVENAHEAYQSWRETPWEIKKASLLRLATLARAKRDDFARLMAEEMGKPLSAGLTEIEKCAWVCEHYATYGEGYLAPKAIQTEMKSTKVVYKPLGVVLAVMPWNFPCWQVFRCAVPAIAAGNTMVLKHAPISTGTGEAIAELFLKAGFPQHVFQHLIIDNEIVSDLIAHQLIIGITFTGSADTGRLLASRAGRALKPIVLELGGNDPAIVLEDADIEHAADIIVASRLNNTGQVCIAAKRIIVVESVKKEFFKAILSAMKRYVVGNPLESGILMGPMARADLRDKLHQQIQISIQQGAHLALGGTIPDQKGFYYPITLLTNVLPGMPAFDEELFGPVIALVDADNEAHALQLANQTQYGLGASIFTRDEAKGEHIAMDILEAGTCFVNGKVTSDPRVPFGGIKLSGFGRELGREGMMAFVNIKTVAVGND